MITFLKNHIEKLILAVALLGLMTVAGLLAFRVGQLEKTTNLQVPKGKTMKPLETAILDQLVDRTTRPPKWTSGRRTFTPPVSVWTMDRTSGLYMLVPIGQIEEGAKGDIQDVPWLKKYNLPNVPGVAEEDPDRDGFTNLEEHDYNSDPTDAKSFPQASDYITYLGPKRQPFYLRFLGYTKSGDGSYTFQININDFDYTYFVREGQQIASGARKENYFVDKFEFEETEEFDSSTHSKRKKEVSRLFVHRGDDPTPIKLTYKQVAVDTLPRARLRNEFEKNARGGAEQVVAKGDEFQMRGKTYKVVDIKETEVIIADTLAQQEFVIKPPKGGQ